MRLSVSISLWLAAAVLILLGGHGWIQLHEERADLDAAARRELTLMATAIRNAVENAIRDSQEPDVTTLLEQLEVKDPAVDVFVFDEAGSTLGSSEGAGGNLAKARGLARASAIDDPLHVEALGSGELAATTPLRIAGTAAGHLVVIRPLNALEADLADERQAVVWSAGLLITSLSLIIWAVVRLRVQVPMDRIIAGVRQIRGGELSVRIGLTGSDELSELAGEFDAMTESLERARVEIARAAEARERLETEMQRANRMAIVGEFAATLAHEIGSPLQVLHGRASDLAARQDLPRDATRSATILVEQTERIHAIVERLLDVARRKAPGMVELDVEQQAGRMLELVSTHARRLGVRLDSHYEHVPRVHGDPAQVQQVVLNLLQNALRATPRGGTVRLSVSRSSFARHADDPPRASVAITVEDTGNGIPEPHLDQVFEPFFTAWSDDQQPKGTGLGLAVVRSIVHDHGGIVSVTNVPGGGACFVVHFPVEHATRQLT